MHMYIYLYQRTTSSLAQTDVWFELNQTACIFTGKRNRWVLESENQENPRSY